MAATHLIHHTSGYIFRYCIPPDIQPIIQKRELRYSLKTGSLRYAKARARVMACYVSAMIVDIRGGGVLAAASADEINCQLRAALRETTGQVFKRPITDTHQMPGLTGGMFHSRPNKPVTMSDSKDTAISPKLSVVLQRYCREAKVSGKWAPKSAEEITGSLELFVKVHGNHPIHTIGKKDVREYKETLMRLPSNHSKRGPYQGKSIQEILAMRRPKASEILSPGTINNLLGRLAAFFKYALNHGYVATNPAAGMQITIKKRADEYRDAFDTGDLKALFGSNEYREDGFKRGYQFWTPIIALYTGCRIEEICQLHLDDIRKEDGLWVLDINEDKEKKLKNMSSKRLVPLHAVLADELNLPAYAESLRAEGHDRLFPNLSNLPAVSHRDEDKANNHMENLEWISTEDNIRYGTAIARRSKPILQLTTAGNVIQEWPSSAEAQRNGFTSGAISNVCLGKSETHAGYGWCFADEYQEAA